MIACLLIERGHRYPPEDVLCADLNAFTLWPSGRGVLAKSMQSRLEIPFIRGRICVSQKVAETEVIASLTAFANCAAQLRSPSFVTAPLVLIYDDARNQDHRRVPAAMSVGLGWLNEGPRPSTDFIPASLTAV